MRIGIGLPAGFLRWIRLILPQSAKKSSLALER
jgi:hypothetical protein